MAGSTRRFSLWTTTHSLLPWISTSPSGVSITYSRRKFTRAGGSGQVRTRTVSYRRGVPTMR